MDRRTFIVATTACLVLPTLARAERLVVNSPGDGYLNLRSGPGSKFNVLRRMTHGTLVDTMEYSGNWVRVRHESGAVGWAYSKYLVRPTSTSAKRVYSPGDGYLNLRTGPGVNFSIVREMYNGEWVTILERSGTWVRVRHQSGAEGWASAKFLRD